MGDKALKLKDDLKKAFNAGDFDKVKALKKKLNNLDLTNEEFINLSYG